MSSPKIAIIGNGASGLAVARVFSRNGVPPVILEKDAFLGGVWNYQPNSKTRPMYRGLRTNLPKEIMAFREFPFPNPNGPSFVTHEKVQEYLELYQKQFDLAKFVRYHCEVKKLQVLKNQKSLVSPESELWPKIQLEWKDESETIKTDIFDAVCVCNGHYGKPFIPNISGLKEHFQGKIMHSIEYDNPADFKGQTVLCVGARASGSDIAREIAPYATHVYLSDSACPQEETRDNVTWVPTTIAVKSDNSIAFDSCPDVSPVVDCIIFCTGYNYDFPFIQDSRILQFKPGEKRVMPLYEQLWHAHYPTLTFPGIPQNVVPFPLVELQAEAIYAQFFQDCKLPSLGTRVEAAEKDATSGGFKQTGRIQDTHNLGSGQWDYCRVMAKLAGIFDKNMDNRLIVNEVRTSWDEFNTARRALSLNLGFLIIF